jgi:hypothetical protein
MWIRLLDKKREEDTRRDPSKRWRERVRIVPQHQKETEFPALPTGMPIDYFDPRFYNNLQPRLHNSVTTGKISMLFNVNDSFTGHSDEKLSDAQFTAQYAASILEKYNLVSEAELQDIGEDSSENDDDEEGEGDWLGEDDLSADDLEDIELEDMEGMRQVLAAHLNANQDAI